MASHNVPVQPPPKPFIGNLPQLTAHGALAPSLCKLLEEYDHEAVRLVVDNRELYVTCHPEIAEKITCDTEDFGKITHLAKRGVFYAARKAVGKALFTASDTEEEWGIAHRILIPAFSLRGMKPVVDIARIATQNIVDNLAECSPEVPIEIGGLMTCITFDVIGKFSAGVDFDTTKDPSVLKTHPFLTNMETMMHNMVKVGASPVLSKLNRSSVRSARRSRDAIDSFVDDIIEDRRSGRVKTDQEDLLDLMLNSADPQTGKKMSPELIRQQILTFFVAGHDSTSSLLTSVIYFLTQHPEVEERIVQEITSVVGDRPVSYDVLKKLAYTTQVINESLRLNPPAAGNQKVALRDTTAGDYFVKADTVMVNSTLAMHTNPKIWGPNAHEFNPDRFSPEEVAKRHKFAFLPFSSGARACIGMQLSLTEARVALAMILPRFTFRLHKSAKVYQDYSQVFAKFRDVFVTVHPRGASVANVDTSFELPARLLRTPSSHHKLEKEPHPDLQAAASVEGHGTPLRIFFGSNMGTCQGLAKQLLSEASRLGFSAEVHPLDAAPAEIEALRGTKGSALVVTSTYNGTPPDNARGFAKWVDGLDASALEGLSFALLGVGNSNWKTYQAFPRRAAAALQAAGAASLCTMGEADEEDDLDAITAAWSRDFWGAALGHAGQAHLSGAAMAAAPAGPAVAKIKVEIAPTGAKPSSCTEAVNEKARQGTVVAVRELQASGSDRHTRHVDIELPEGVKYNHGDHLAVLPVNSPELTLEVARLLGEELSKAVVLTSEAGSAAHLPYGQAITIRALLRDHVDLQAPVTDALLEAVAAAAQCPPEREALEAMLEARRTQERSVEAPAGGDFSQLRLTEILRRFRSAPMSLTSVLPLLTPMKQRYYSISSSPAGPQGPRVASLTVGLVEGPTSQEPAWQGVASGFLHHARPGDSVRVFVASNDRFRLPADPSAPVLMVGPGTGLAPFMGFLQQMHTEGSKRQAALFFGCRTQADFIYREELEAAARDGSLEMLEVAFSRAAGVPKAYVQDRLWAARETVWEMLRDGGHLYVCGDARYMAKDVDATLVRIAREVGGKDGAAAREYVDNLSEGDRYVQDVWAN